MNRGPKRVEMRSEKKKKNNKQETKTKTGSGRFDALVDINKLVVLEVGQIE